MTASWQPESGHRSGELHGEERVLRTFARVSEWRYFAADRIASPLLRGLAPFEHASPLHVSARAA
jgi:hypothetical protein